MKKSRTVRYTSEEIKKLPSESDWKAADAMTEEEIEAAIASDPEERWEPLAVDDREEGMIVMCPEGGELRCYPDGTVVVIQGAKMYQFRLPPGAKIFVDKNFDKARMG